MNDRLLTSTSLPTRIALGCMGMSGAYGKTDDAQSMTPYQSRGVRLIKDPDVYNATCAGLGQMARTFLRMRGDLELSLGMLVAG